MISQNDGRSSYVMPMYYGLWRFAKLPIIKAAMIQLSKHFQLNDAHLVNKFIFVGTLLRDLLQLIIRSSRQVVIPSQQ